MKMIDKIKGLIAILILLLSTIGVVSAQKMNELNEFDVKIDETNNPMTIYSDYGATANDGVVIINSAIPDLEFGIMSVAKERLRKVVPDKGKNRYLLIIQPNDSNYKQYTITINAKGFMQGKIYPVVVNAGLSTSYIVNPKYEVKPNPVKKPLYVDGWTIYRNGKELSDNEIRTLFANTESYNLYVNGIKKKDGGMLYKWIIILGSGSVGGGVAGLIVEAALSENPSYNTEYWLLGGGVAAIGIGWLGLKLQSSTGRKNIQKAVDLYNNRNSRSQNGVEIEYGLTGNGVYFSLNF